MITSPGVVEGLQFLADLRNVSNAIPTSANMPNWQDAFVTGAAAMEMVGHWRIPYFAETLEFNWNMAPLPAGAASVNRVDGSGFAIHRSTQHPEEAWEFVKFLAAPDGLGIRLLNQLQQLTPATLSLVQSEDFMRPQGLEHLNKTALLAGDQLYSMYEPLGPMYFPIDATMRPEIQSIWSGQQSAAQATSRLEPILGSLLASLRQRFQY